ncbi:hypothetical protein NHX12_005292 [Muraenolepis orangiensis]|uniref:Platelet-derived growth factor (PDGF) family profile domain-containing protein n=1 Tax=Muraenolepis orangiensis TaxID=630683 RepID=A0A9Q0DP36_9TELE|nr:hypothetical protein NHX12_005292 [Muraenolepis orangiensis]
MKTSWMAMGQSTPPRAARGPGNTQRCNGCCNTEGATCRNTTATYVNKTLLSVIPFKFGPEPVLIKVANHTECKCMDPPIIRRNARPPKKRGCSPMHQLADSENFRRVCATGMLWDCMENRCIPYPASTPEFSLNSWLPDCELDPERCACLPRPPGPPPSRPPGPPPYRPPGPPPYRPPGPPYRCQINATFCAGLQKPFERRSCRSVSQVLRGLPLQAGLANYRFLFHKSFTLLLF